MSSTASTTSPFVSENEEHDDDDPQPSQASTAEEDINIQLSSKLFKIVKSVCGFNTLINALLRNLNLKHYFA